MTKPVEGGRVTRDIALDCMDVHLRAARLFKVAALDLSDGDHDTRAAVAAIAELNLLNTELMVVRVREADGDMAGAQLAAMRLAAVDAKGL